MERKNKGKPFPENTLFGTKRKIFKKTVLGLAVFFLEYTFVNKMKKRTSNP
jgi:hypothetical protein